MFTNSEYKEYTKGLTDGQNVAFHKITEWFFDFYETDLDKRKDKQIFVLSGYAGTGKSYLIGVLDRFFREYYGSDDTVQACAFTGKAATVLSEKGMNSSTLHRLLYVPVVTKRLNEETDVVVRNVRWKRKHSLDDRIKLIIVDECSMLPEKLLEDLKMFNLPILAVGDGFQLPSIDVGTNLLDDPDYTLTEITRQAADNSIIRLSMVIRNNGEIPYGDYGDNVQVVSKKSLNFRDYEQILENYDQFLVGTNKSRVYFNTLFRRYLLGEHFDSNPLPCEGEKIIVIQNNWDFELDPQGEYNLFNGLVGRVNSVESTNLKELDKLKLDIEFGKKKFTSNWIIYDTGIFRESLDVSVRQPHFEQDQYLMIDDKGNYLVKKEAHDIKKMTLSERKDYVNTLYNSEDDKIKINQLDFAYAISVHKFQGSEAKNVCVFDESYVFDKDGTDYKNRWLYTAITRGKNFVLLVR